MNTLISNKQKYKCEKCFICFYNLGSNKCPECGKKIKTTDNVEAFHFMNDDLSILNELMSINEESSVDHINQNWYEDSLWAGDDFSDNNDSTPFNNNNNNNNNNNMKFKKS
jgi:hypothetical protein